MKVFVVVALFHSFIVGINSNLCEEKGADPGAAEEHKSMIRAGAAFVFGHCSSFDIESLLFTGPCSHVFEQSFCYGQLAQAYYGSLEVVTYKHLAAVDYTEQLGDAACQHGLACFATVKATFSACAKEGGFVDGVIKAIENYYRSTYGRELLKGFVNDHKTQSHSILGDLVNLVFDKFPSVQAVREGIEELVDDDMLSDAEFAHENAFVEAAVAWCESSCTAVTGSFLEKLFKHMDKGRKCRDASKFCGNCQRRADAFLDNHDIPCCLNNVLQQSNPGVTYVKEKYNGLIDDFRTYFSGRLSKRAVVKAKKMKKRLIKEITCMGKSYNGGKNDCESA